MKYLRWIVLALILIMINFSYQAEPKKALADLQGKTCTTNEQCSCYTNDGVGFSQCNNNKCDTTFCADYKPIKTWITENPWAYLKNHIMFTVLLAALVLIFIFFPKI